MLKRVKKHYIVQYITQYDKIYYGFLIMTNSQHDDEVNVIGDDKF